MPLSSVGDHDLLGRIARRDCAAFAELYDRFAPRVFGLLIKLLHNRTDAEDVLQDVFLHVWRSADRYDASLSHPIVWLMLIARARAIDAMRKRSSQVDCAAEATNRNQPGAANAHFRSQENGVTDHVMSHARVATGDLRPALAALPAEQSDAITLAFHGGLTSAQIADLRGVPLGTVKTRIRLGMIKLREIMSHNPRTARTPEATT